MEENKQKYELTKFEHELLVFLQTEGYNYIAKDSSGEFAPPRLVACDKKLPYHNLSGMFTTYKSNAFHIGGQLISMFQHMKTMSNDNAIKHIRHEDIDTTCGYLLEDKQEIEKLEKALDEACKRLSYENEITCMHLKQQYAWAKNKVPKTKEQIKEELMKND